MKRIKSLRVARVFSYFSFRFHLLRGNINFRFFPKLLFCNDFLTQRSRV